MRSLIRKLLVINTMLVLCWSISPAQATGRSASSGKSAHHSSGKRRHRARKASWKRKGQKGIQPARVTEIQQALIREKYLTGEPTGVWDARTQAALVRYQGDNGWQTKVVPDSRALIKLGLGPDYSAQQIVNTESKLGADSPANTASASTGAATRDKQ